MKVLSKFQQGIAVLLLLVFSVFIYTSCTSGYASSPATTKLKTSNTYSGEDFFKGIVFQNGPIADMIPEIVDQNALLSKLNPNSGNQNEMRQLENSIIAKIAETDAKYFSEFKEAMQSGNQIIIQKKIQESQDIVFGSLAKLMGLQIRDVKLAKQQINEFISKNHETLKSLLSQFQAKAITKEQYLAEVSKVIGDNNTGISALFPAKTSEGASINNESIPFLTFLVWNVAIVINIAGYINIALAANVEIAVNAQVAVNIDIKVNITRDAAESSKNNSIFYAQFINSIAGNLKKTV